MKCKRCGEKIKKWNEEEGKKLGYAGRSNYCSTCWTWIKEDIKKQFGSKKLANKYGLKRSKVRNIKNRSFNRPEESRGDWKIKDIIRG